MDLKTFLESKVSQYNRPNFITNDPIVIPHEFSRKQDIEIMGFWAAILAWGQRVTIINKCHELIRLMDGAPYDFIINHQETDLKRFLGFKHRTFNDTDALYFLHFFKFHYEHYDSLEDAFLPQVTGMKKVSEFREDFMEEIPEIQDNKSGSSPACYGQELVRKKETIEDKLNHFRTYFFSLPDFPRRTI
ncbi:MAG TPA: DUF2400 family protein, partial [Sphingobacteriaceae bacterium]